MRTRSVILTGSLLLAAAAGGIAAQPTPASEGAPAVVLADSAATAPFDAEAATRDYLNRLSPEERA